MSTNVFVSGDYLRKIPKWHVEDSSWKAQGVFQMIERNRLSPGTIGEVGCGAGEVLKCLQLRMDPKCLFCGYDIAPAAIELCRGRENDRLQFRLADVTKEPTTNFDLLLLLDVL